MSQINEAIDRWAESAIRKHTLALELARLDELQEVFYARALEGDVSCGALVTMILERRCVMLGLHTPQTAVLQTVDEAKSKETSTDRIERLGEVADALFWTLKAPLVSLCRRGSSPVSTSQRG